MYLKICKNRQNYNMECIKICLIYRQNNITKQSNYYKHHRGGIGLTSERIYRGNMKNNNDTILSDNNMCDRKYDYDNN